MLHREQGLSDGTNRTTLVTAPAEGDVDMTGAMSPTHWLIVLGVVLLLFGARRLPEAARGLGRSLRILRAETAALADDRDASADDGDGPTPRDRAS